MASSEKEYVGASAPNHAPLRRVGPSYRAVRRAESLSQFVSFR